MTEHVKPSAEYPAVQHLTSFLVKKTDYDEHGRPLFHEALERRPVRAGEQFTFVQSLNNRPIRSYDIAVVEQKPDMRRPLKVIYEWTGKGFATGLNVTGHLSQVRFEGSGKDAGLYLAFVTAPIVIGGVTGFVVGIVSCLPDTATELKHLVVNARETVIGYTVYEYDEKERIRFMKLYPPDEHARELVRTEFFYSGEGEAPVRTEVTSVVEKTVREIR